MTADEIKAEIEAAMQTLKHMPGDGPRDPGSAWPDVFHDRHEAYGWQPATYNRIPPTIEDVTRMDNVLNNWLPRLTADARILVTARGDGLSWRRIQRIKSKLLHSRSHEGHRQAHKRVIESMARWVSA